MSTDEKPCETLINFFSDVIPTLNIPKPKSFPMANNNLDPIMYVIKSFDKHRVQSKSRLKRFIQPFISEELAVMKLKKLPVISTLKSLASKKIFPLRLLS